MEKRPVSIGIIMAVVFLLVTAAGIGLALLSGSMRQTRFETEERERSRRLDRIIEQSDPGQGVSRDAVDKYIDKQGAQR